MKMITIHPGMWKKDVRKYGFESSQLARKKISDYLGWEYIYILTAPQVRENWKNGYEKMGFQSNEIINICNYQSDIGHDDLSVLPEEIFIKYPNAKVNQINGFVASVEEAGEILYFTSGLYMKKKKNGELEWYNKDGSVVLSGRKYDPKREVTPIEILKADYIYFKDNMWLTTEELLIKLLIDITDSQDIIIRDQYDEVSPKLWRYVENTNKNYYEYIHNNALENILSNLRKKTKYLVASEILADILKDQGYKAKFMPPMIVTKDKKPITERKNPRSYCYVGNMTENKRLGFVVDAFSILYRMEVDVEVTLYGGEEDLIREKYPHITPNIKIAGYVDEVPYWKHDGYISASKRELFANACVEAMSNGLICILSNVDIAHKYYAHYNKDIKLFDTSYELMEIIKNLYYINEIMNTDSTVAFVEKYDISKVSQMYTKLNW